MIQSALSLFELNCPLLYYVVLPRTAAGPSNPASTPTSAAASRAECQKLDKNSIEKFVKLTDDTYAGDNLKNFEYEAHANLMKFLWKKLVKSHEVNLFMAGFNHLKPQCDRGE